MLGRPTALVSCTLMVTIGSLGLPKAVWAADPPATVLRPSQEQALTPPRLVEQVDLDYPAAARQLGVHGDVSVLVQVGEDGSVVSVEVESGPEIFHEAAIAGAQSLRFEPARRGGVAVVVTTRVHFHFAPPVPPGEGPDIEIVVHATDPDLADVRARTTLDEAELRRSTGSDLAETVSQVAGVRIAGGTADASKPIIRGQQERRLLVLNDGIRHESQKWGPDHGTEIDPFSAGQISVVRGAAGARYGPDAIGGVILVEPPPLREEAGVGGKGVLAYTSNGRRPYGAVRLDVVPEGAPGLSMRIEGNHAVGASRTTPDYVLGNTASEVTNLGMSLGLRHEDSRLRASWRHYDLRAGIFYGVQSSSPSAFRDQLARDRPATADLWSVTTDLDRPLQDVAHDVLSVHGETSGAWGSLVASYAFQLNRRQEADQVRDSVTRAQFDFTLRTHSLDVLLEHAPLILPGAELSGGMGLQGSVQENVFTGVPLLPNFRAFGAGAFAFERLSLARVDLEVGGRVDGLARTAFMTDNDFERHERRGNLDDERCDFDGVVAQCPASYQAGSLSVGGLLHLVPEHLDLKVDASVANRFPNVDELYLIGSAPSFPVFALGSPDLGVETAYSLSVTTGLRLPWLQAEASAYANDIRDYIYFAPEFGDDGQPLVDVTIRGAWPRFSYRPIRAGVSGLDGSLQLGPQAVVGVDLLGAIVRATDRATGEQLVGTPPDHLRVDLVVRPPLRGPIREVSVRASVDAVARQSRVDPALDFAPAPAGFALLGLSAEASLGRGPRPLRIGVQGRNLLNETYREYTSLLRYYADQPGRDLQVRLGTDF
ncbi:MAG: TonB-dependent receptor [Myxococcales bacterium]|nr:TonB-dependent receptor [Myxococcales bacterium]